MYLENYQLGKDWRDYVLQKYGEKTTGSMVKPAITPFMAFVAKQAVGSFLGFFLIPAIQLPLKK